MSQHAPSDPIVGATPKQLMRLAEAGLTTRAQLCAHQGKTIRFMSASTLDRLKSLNAAPLSSPVLAPAPAPGAASVPGVAGFRGHSWHKLVPHVNVDGHVLRGVVHRMVVAPDMLGFEVETVVPGQGRGRSFMSASALWAAHYLWLQGDVVSDDSDDDGEDVGPGHPQFKDPRDPLFMVHGFDRMLPKLSVDVPRDKLTDQQCDKVKMVVNEVNQLRESLMAVDTAVIPVQVQKSVRFNC